MATTASPDRPPDGRDVPRRDDVDAATARGLGTARALAAGQPRGLAVRTRTIGYFDPDYTYDEGHEYELDWTTDPHLGADVHHLILDEDGFVSLRNRRHNQLIEAFVAVLADLLGNRVEGVPELHFDPDFGRRADMYTVGGQVST